MRTSPGYYKGQPKPELSRIIVDVASKTASVQVLSHRCARNQHARRNVKLIRQTRFISTNSVIEPLTSGDIPSISLLRMHPLLACTLCWHMHRYAGASSLALRSAPPITATAAAVASAGKTEEAPLPA